jgi:hypothetical protein
LKYICPMETKTIRLPENDALTREWAEALGRFYQGMGWVETIAMEFIAKMAVGFKYKSMKKKFLGQKLTYIIDNLGDHAEAPDGAIESIHEALEEARQLSFFRNMLSNASMGLPGANEGKADAGGDKALSVTGMLNYRPDDGDQEAEIVSLEEVKGRVEEAVALAGKLAGLFNGLKFTGTEFTGTEPTGAR